MTDSWFPGTFEGAEVETRRASALATPQQRWEWLLSALELARDSGALDILRQQETADLLAAWESGGP